MADLRNKSLFIVDHLFHALKPDCEISQTEYDAITEIARKHWTFRSFSSNTKFLLGKHITIHADFYKRVQFVSTFGQAVEDANNDFGLSSQEIQSLSIQVEEFLASNSDMSSLSDVVTSLLAFDADAICNEMDVINEQEDMEIENQEENNHIIDNPDFHIPDGLDSNIFILKPNSAFTDGELYTNKDFISKLNHIINSPVTEEIHNASYLIRVLIKANISELTSNKIIKAFRKFGNIPFENFQQLKTMVLKASCVRRCMRYFVRCKHCLKLQDTPKMFCPTCLKNHLLVPLYNSCRNPSCICHNVIIPSNPIDASNVEYYSKFYCFHLSRTPTEGYVCYLPPIALIGDLMHSNLWNGLRGLTEDTQLPIASFCRLSKGYHYFTGLNSYNIYERAGWDRLINVIKPLHKSIIPNQDSCSLLLSLYTSNSSTYYNTFVFYSILFREVFKFTQLPNKEEIRRVIPSMASQLKLFYAMSNHGYDDNSCKSLLIDFLIFCRSSQRGLRDSEIQKEIVALLNSLKDCLQSFYSDKPYKERPFEPCVELFTKFHNISNLSMKDANHDNVKKKFSIHVVGEDSCLKYGLAWMSKMVLKREDSQQQKTVFPVLWESNIRTIVKSIGIRAHLENIADALHKQRDDCDRIISGSLRKIYDYGDINEEVTTNFLSHICKLIDYLKDKGVPTQLELLNKIRKTLAGEEDNRDEPLNLKVLFKPFEQMQMETTQIQPYMNNGMIRDYMSKQMNSVKKLQVFSIKKEIPVFTLAFDDVQTFHYSSNSNSSSCISMYNHNMNSRFHFKDVDMVFNIIVPVAKPTCLQRERTLVIQRYHLRLKRIRDLFRECSRIRKSSTLYHRRPVMVGSQIVRDLFNTEYSQGFVTKKFTPTNFIAREAAGLMLKDCQYLAEKGIPLVYNHDIHVVMPIINGIRADNPGADTFFDSSGKQSSNFPCLLCNCTYSAYETFTNEFSTNLNWIITGNKNNKKVFLTVLPSTELDDLLRLITPINMLRDYSTEFIVTSLCKGLEDDPILTSYLSCRVSHMKEALRVLNLPLWVPPTVHYWPSFNSLEELEHHLPTNSIYTVGKVNSIDHLINPSVLSRIVDVMHLCGNLVDSFLSLFNNKEGEIEKSLYTSLNAQLRREGVIKEKESIETPCISLDVKKKITALVEAHRGFLDSKVLSIIDNIFGRENCAKKNGTTHDKMVFAFCIMPWLFQCHMDIPLIYHYTELLNLLSCFYTYNGNLEGAARIQKKIQISLHIIENLHGFDSLTINSHLLLHLYDTYKRFGCLMFVDCLYPESMYKKLAHPVISKNPTTTMFYRQSLIAASSLNSVKEKPPKSYQLKCSIDTQSSMWESILDCFTPCQWKIRIAVAYSTYQQMRYSDFVRVAEIFDVESVTTMESFLYNGFDSDTAPLLSSNAALSLATSDDLLCRFATECVGLSEEDMIVTEKNDCRFYSDYESKDIKMTSTSKMLKDLTKRDFLNCQNAFAMIASSTGQCILVAILGFVEVVIKNDPFPMAIVYIIPTLPIVNDERSNHSMIIDFRYFSRCHSVLHLVGVNRLIPSLSFANNFYQADSFHLFVMQTHLKLGHRME